MGSQGGRSGGPITVRLEISIADGAFPIVVARGVNAAGDRLWALGHHQ